MNSFYTVKHQNKNIKYNYYVRCNNKSCELKGKVYNASKIEKELIHILNDLSGIAVLSKYSLNFPKQDKKDDLNNIQGILMKLKNDENKYVFVEAVQKDGIEPHVREHVPSGAQCASERCRKIQLFEKGGQLFRHAFAAQCQIPGKALFENGNADTETKFFAQVQVKGEFDRDCADIKQRNRSGDHGKNHGQSSV